MSAAPTSTRATPSVSGTSADRDRLIAALVTPEGADGELDRLDGLVALAAIGPGAHARVALDILTDPDGLAASSQQPWPLGTRRTREDIYTFLDDPNHPQRHPSTSGWAAPEDLDWFCAEMLTARLARATGGWTAARVDVEHVIDTEGVYDGMRFLVTVEAIGTDGHEHRLSLSRHIESNFEHFAAPLADFLATTSRYLDELLDVLGTARACIPGLIERGGRST